GEVDPAPPVYAEGPALRVFGALHCRPPLLWDRDFLEDLAENLPRGRAAVLRGAGPLLHDAVRKHVHGDGLDVVGRRIVAAVDERVGTGGGRQVDGAAGADRRVVAPVVTGHGGE